MSVTPGSASGSAVKPTKGGAIATALAVATLLVVVLAAVSSFALLRQAFRQPSGIAQSDFDKVAIGALIGILGTGVTALAAVFSATRQSATAYRIQQLSTETAERLARYNREGAERLAESDARLQASLASLKAASDAGLSRLNAALNIGPAAYFELFGAATVNFYALRGFAYGTWDGEQARAADAVMITATRHLIHVDAEMRNQWFEFWQRSQHVFGMARRIESDPQFKTKVAELIEEVVSVGAGKRNLREMHEHLEKTASAAFARATGP